jgi:hypothetical protein
VERDEADEIRFYLGAQEAISQSDPERPRELRQAGELEATNDAVDWWLITPESDQTIKVGWRVPAGETDNVWRRRSEPERQAAEAAHRRARAPELAPTAHAQTETGQTVRSKLLAAQAGCGEQLSKNQFPDSAPNA